MPNGIEARVGDAVCSGADGRSCPRLGVDMTGSQPVHVNALGVGAAYFFSVGARWH